MATSQRETRSETPWQGAKNVRRQRETRTETPTRDAERDAKRGRDVNAKVEECGDDDDMAARLAVYMMIDDGGACKPIPMTSRSSRVATLRQYSTESRVREKIGRPCLIRLR